MFSVKLVTPPSPPPLRCSAPPVCTSSPASLDCRPSSPVQPGVQTTVHASWGTSPTPSPLSCARSPTSWPSPKPTPKCWPSLCHSFGATTTYSNLSCVSDSVMSYPTRLSNEMPRGCLLENRSRWRQRWTFSCGTFQFSLCCGWCLTAHVRYCSPWLRTSADSRW